MATRLELDIRQLKDNTPCADCANTFPWWVMQFDHITGQKVGNVSALVRQGNRQVVMEEVQKCELVCANCHATRTHLRGAGVID